MAVKTQKPDINEIGVLYVKSRIRQEATSARSFNPASIQEFETRDPQMRMMYDSFNLQYLQDWIRRMNHYPGMNTKI